MASTYGNDLRLEEIGDGEQSGTWGATTNTNLELIAEALSFGTEAITTNADTHITTIADGATDPGRSLYLKYTGTLDSTCTITIAPNSISKTWYIENGTSGSQSIIISQGSGANVTIPTGQTKVVYSDGAGSGAAMAEIGTLGVTNLNVSGDITVGDDLTVTDDMTVGGTLGVTGVLTGTSLDISGNVDIDGTTNLDAVDIDGAVQIDATVNVGVDDTGYDVKFFGDTASAYMQWDASADDLILGGAAGLVVPQDKLTIASTAVTSTAAELNQLDAITRGSILYGNASGATARLAKGAADTVLTSDGTDISWAASGGAFAASTVTVSDHTTLTAAQNGNLVNITAASEKVISLPAAAAGAFYVFNNDTSHIMYIKPNGTNTINGVGASLALAADASGIVACGGSTANWSTIGMTRTSLIVKATTFYNDLKNVDNGARLTGTYTPFNSGSGLLVCVGSGVAGAGTSTSSSYYYRGGGSGGQSYAEKFIASPASSYAYDIPCGPSRNGHSGSYSLATTAAGMSCTFGPSGVSGHSSGNVAGRSGGTASGGTVNFTGGSGASATTSKSGGGGGAASRAGNGGNATTGYGGGTGGNNATSSAVGAAATARDSSTYAISGVTSETFLAGTIDTADGDYSGSGAGPKTVVNVGSLNFTIADAYDLSQGGPVGAGAGGYSRYGLGGYVTFVEFF